MLEKYLKAKGYQQLAFKNYLIENASEPLKEKIVKSGKNIADAEMFIASEILKEGKYQKFGNYGVSNADDDFVFGMLIHYFEEEEIPVQKGLGVKGVKASSEPVKVVAPTVKPVKKVEPKKVEEPHQTTLFDFM